MAIILLLIKLVACEDDLVSVDNDHKVTRVNVRSIYRFMLAAQKVGDLAGQPSQGLSSRIDHIPLARHILCVGHKSGAHGDSLHLGDFK